MWPRSSLCDLRAGACSVMLTSLLLLTQRINTCQRPSLLPQVRHVGQVLLQGLLGVQWRSSSRELQRWVTAARS